MHARIRLRVSPGAARTRVTGPYGDGWKLRVAAPPEGGRANREVVRYLAELVGIAPSEVTIVSGAGGRDKLVELRGVDAAMVAAALARVS